MEYNIKNIINEEAMEYIRELVKRYAPTD